VEQMYPRKSLSHTYEREDDKSLTKMVRSCEKRTKRLEYEKCSSNERCQIMG